MVNIEIYQNLSISLCFIYILISRIAFTLTYVLCISIPIDTVLSLFDYTDVLIKTARAVQINRAYHEGLLSMLFAIKLVLNQCFHKHHYVQKRSTWTTLLHIIFLLRMPLWLWNTVVRVDQWLLMAGYQGCCNQHLDTSRVESRLKVA